MELGDAGAASPGESRTRAIVVGVGLPRPTTQIPVPGPRGALLFVDLGMETYRVGIEYDGEAYHRAQSNRAHDRRRRAWLRAQDWYIIPVTKHDIFGDPRPFLTDYLDALRARGWHLSDDELTDILTRIHRLRPRRRRSATKHHS